MFKQTQLQSGGFSKEMQELLEQSLLESGITDAKNIVNSEYNIGSDLSNKQKIAFELFKNGDNILVLGEAGTGKSKLIKTMENYIKTEYPNKNIYITSTTGISAFSVGGVTIHSFLGIGTAEQSVEYLINKILKKKEIKERIINTDILIIDEISMLSASIFEKINIICQHFRKSKKVFGGIQVVFTGDMLQLLCIFNNNIEIYGEQDTRLIVESNMFNSIFKKNQNIVVLDENFRQKGNPKFIELLGRFRIGEFTDNDIKTIQSRIISKELIPPVDIIYLTSTNKKAQSINEEHLKNLPGSTKSFKIKNTSKSGNKETCEMLEKELQLQFSQRGLINLNLKKNCRVMLIKNLDVNVGLVNGALGTVVDFTIDGVKVKFDNGSIHTILRAEFQLELDHNSIKATQIPLMIAACITISKSQSLSLDSAILDLGNCFADSMCYVAISRLRTLDKMYIERFDKNKITINKTMKNYMDSLNAV
jgi:ATP-dependent DNA helicase PIF1